MSRARFDGGVRWYTRKIARINFPEDAVACIACPCLGNEYDIKRPFCRLTGEYIPDPEYMVGGGCPLEDDTSDLPIYEETDDA